MAETPSSGHDQTPMPPDEVVRRGRDLYERSIRAELEPVHDGKFLVINVATGEYELDSDDVEASSRARQRFGDAPMFSMRVGRNAAYRIGSGTRSRPQC